MAQLRDSDYRAIALNENFKTAQFLLYSCESRDVFFSHLEAFLEPPVRTARGGHLFEIKPNRLQAEVRESSQGGKWGVIVRKRFPYGWFEASFNETDFLLRMMVSDRSNSS